MNEVSSCVLVYWLTQRIVVDRSHVSETKAVLALCKITFPNGCTAAFC